MKRLFLLAFLVIMALILVNRQRVYVRDPLASVYQAPAGNGAAEVKEAGVQVYINYSNDVLLWKESQPGAYNLVVQHWNRVPATPVQLKCIHWMACLTDAEHASVLPVRAGSGYDPKVEMTDREVSYIAPQGERVRVQLR